jgi:hypothetical protein
MVVSIHMLGDAGPYPFAGSFRCALEGSQCWLRASGRIAVSDGIVGSYLPARTIEAAISQAASAAVDQPHRHVLLHELWDCVSRLSKTQLGSGKGSDLCLAITVGDREGVDIAAVGVSGLWGRLGREDRWCLLVEKGHPMLCPPGIPSELPGSLTVGRPPSCIVASPSFMESRLPPIEQLPARVGRKAI